LVGYGSFEAWDSYYRLPHRYADLRANGLPRMAKLVRCAPGIGGGRGVGCRLSLRSGERLRTWNYPEDSAQFKRLAAGAPIPVLVDPSNSTIVYTVHDVDNRTNAGTSPVFWFGIGVGLFGLAGLALLLWLWRETIPRPDGQGSVA
jgi:hypothetical protein